MIPKVSGERRGGDGGVDGIREQQGQSGWESRCFHIVPGVRQFKQDSPLLSSKKFQRPGPGAIAEMP
jgi:hypothetical protein